MSGAQAQPAAGEGEASVQPRVGPPDTTYYMNVGYVVAFVVFGLYIGLLLRRVANIRRSS